MKTSSLFLTLALSTPVMAATTTIGSSNDTWIRDGFSHAANGIDGTLDWRLSFVPYIQFDVSTLAIDTISAATLRITKVPSSRNDAIVDTRFGTYGLPSGTGLTLQNWDELADFDPTDATQGLDFRNVGAEHTLNTGDGVDRGQVISLDPEDGTPNVTETFSAAPGATNAETTIELTGDALVAFLNTRADDNGLVTFMFPFEQANRGAGIASKENATAAWRPALDLTYTAVPEPSVALLGGLGLLGLLRRRR